MLYAAIKFIAGIKTISFFFNSIADKAKWIADVPLLHTIECFTFKND